MTWQIGYNFLIYLNFNNLDCFLTSIDSIDKLKQIEILNL